MLQHARDLDGEFVLLHCQLESSSGRKDSVYLHTTWLSSPEIVSDCEHRFTAVLTGLLNARPVKVNEYECHLGLRRPHPI